MRMFMCRRCDGTIEYARETGSGRLPWYCRPCVEEIYVARIRARNAADKENRRAQRNPLCLACRQKLVRDDSGERMDMHLYCGPCLEKRKNSQDSRRGGKLRVMESNEHEVTA